MLWITPYFPFLYCLNKFSSFPHHPPTPVPPASFSFVICAIQPIFCIYLHVQTLKPLCTFVSSFFAVHLFASSSTTLHISTFDILSLGSLFSRLLERSTLVLLENCQDFVMNWNAYPFLLFFISLLWCLVFWCILSIWNPWSVSLTYLLPWFSYIFSFSICHNISFVIYIYFHATLM